STRLPRRSSLDDFCVSSYHLATYDQTPRAFETDADEIGDVGCRPESLHLSKTPAARKLAAPCIRVRQPLAAIGRSTTAMQRLLSALLSYAHMIVLLLRRLTFGFA